jgi:DNA-binding MarR family transcriptional regulator
MLRLDRSAFLKLLVLVNLTARPFGRLYARRHRITLAEWRVMFTLAGCPGAAAADVADTLGLDKMAVSRAIRALERSGHLKRTTDNKDQRRTALSLTPRGVDIFNQIAPGALKREATLFGVLDPLERRAFIATLDKLIAHVRNLPEPTSKT